MPRVFDNIEMPLLPALQGALKVAQRGHFCAGYLNRPAVKEREPLPAGRMLVITACPPEVRRTTRETALGRNRMVLALDGEIVVPYVADDSPLAALLNERRSA